MRDYDGFIKAWNNFGRVPDTILKFGTFVLVNSDGPIVELGSGNGLLSAFLAKQGRLVLAVDKQVPPAIGEYKYMIMDGNSDEFFDTLCTAPELTLVGRRSLCIFYSDEWMKKLNETNVTTIIVESLDGGKFMVNDPEFEQAYLSSKGWDAFREGQFVRATRSLPPRAGRRHGLILEQPQPEE